MDIFDGVNRKYSLCGHIANYLLAFVLKNPGLL